MCINKTKQNRTIQLSLLHMLWRLLPLKVMSSRVLYKGRTDNLLRQHCEFWTVYLNFGPRIQTFMQFSGEGRVHKCLWDNKDKLSKSCRAQELKIQIMQSSNTELMPNLAKSCKQERAAHCKGVRPGKSRVYNCLLTNSDSVDFSVACKEQLIAQQAKRVRDYRMDYDLRKGCKNDVPKVGHSSSHMMFESRICFIWKNSPRDSLIREAYLVAHLKGPGKDLAISTYSQHSI